MTYVKPELVVLGPATALVQGIPGSVGDNTNADSEHLAFGLAAVSYFAMAQAVPRESTAAALAE